MAEWEKEIAELKTDVKYIREDISIMQKQVRDLNKTSNMGLGGLKVFLLIGGIMKVGSAIISFFKNIGRGKKEKKDQFYLRLLI